MGSQESKPEPTLENIQQTAKETDLTTSFITESVPSTPILTPLDPRSPSANVARTPLEQLLLGVKKTESVESVQDIEETHPKDVVNVVLGIDPRSPTVEFKRTPIIVGAVTKEQPLRLQNKNFDNVLKSTIQTTPTTTSRKTIIVPPKLIGSTIINPATSIIHKRKSFVGLLETNIDYTETDLDTVHQANENANISLPLPVVMSEQSSFSNKLKDQMDALHINEQADFYQVLEQEEHIIEASPEILKTPEPVQILEDTNCDYKCLEDKTINITEQVKDFDKKLTNLIYQDDTEDEDKSIFKFVKLKANNRTPLGTRNSNEEPKKSGSRLKVSDKPRKSDVSKIPVFKEMKKNLIQCENTPPMKMEEKKLKTKVSRWDADKTLII